METVTMESQHSRNPGNSQSATMPERCVIKVYKCMMKKDNKMHCKGCIISHMFLFRLNLIIIIEYNMAWWNFVYSVELFINYSFSLCPDVEKFSDLVVAKICNSMIYSFLGFMSLYWLDWKKSIIWTSQVTYDASRWLDKNRDTLPPGVIEMLQTSSNELVKLIFRGKWLEFFSEV